MNWRTGSAPSSRGIDQDIAAGSPAGRPSLHFIDGQGLLLDPEGQRLYRLNAGATLVWSLLEEGDGRRAVERRLAAGHGFSGEAAARLVREVLHQWRTGRSVSAPAVAAPPPAFAPAAALAQTAPVREHYALHDTRFRVTFGSAALRHAVHPLLQGWATPPESAPGLAPTQPLDVAVVEAGGGVEIGVPGRLVGGAPNVAAAAVALRAALTQLAVERSGGLCVVHAGALAAGGQALLLPGDAGRGKSTLSAGLAASGLEMLSDDTTLLVGDPPGAASLPTGLCVKRGAYPVLAPLLPALLTLPEWSRPDGLVAKYLRPGLDLPWSAAGSVLPVRWLVFPHYDPAHQTQLVPLPRSSALERLLPGVYFLSGVLDAAGLDALIAWIGGVDCYALPLSSLEAAVAEVRRLCR